MFNKTSLQDWETLVKKQLKSDDIYLQLSKENVEDIVVKPYYDEVSLQSFQIPSVEESTHLVAKFDELANDQVYAFLLDENVEGLDEKVIFINNKDLAEHILIEEQNRYFSLVDVFSDQKDGTIHSQLAQELCEKNFERNIAIDVALHQNAGATIVQQLAFALGKTKELIELFGEKIIDKLVYRIAIGGQYFFEIAKIRALKLVINQLSKEFNLNQIPFVYAETSLRNKSIYDPENNLIRSTLELSAAMIGGADAVFSNDYLLKNYSAVSSEISFKQQIVLAYESIINVFQDAGSGSYLIEQLTYKFAEDSWKLFLEIEDEGGYCTQLRSEKIQKLIYNQAIKEQNWIEEGKLKLVGVNLYPKLEKTKSAEDMYNPTEITKVRLAEMYE